jgi:hypothetical protein
MSGIVQPHQRQEKRLYNLQEYWSIHWQWFLPLRHSFSSIFQQKEAMHASSQEKADPKWHYHQPMEQH